MLLTGKPFVFCAGADINEFQGIDPETARLGSKDGARLFARIAALPYPTLAAINGAALGGGVEIAFHCDYRTISTGVRHFAAPEVFLGLFPAWGGTQLVPRLVGIETAIRFNVTILSARTRCSPARRRMSSVSPTRCSSRSSSSTSRSLSSSRPEGPRPSDSLDASEVAEAVEKARRQLDDSLHGAAPAPYKTLELMAPPAGASRRATPPRRKRSPSCFRADRRRPPCTRSTWSSAGRSATRAGRTSKREIKKVGIVGAGLMATQLATLFLRRLEVPIAIRDVDQEIVDRALAGIEAELESQVQKGRYDEGKARFLRSP